MIQFRLTTFASFVYFNTYYNASFPARRRVRHTPTIQKPIEYIPCE